VRNLNTHPADTDNNFVMSLDESTKYGACWRSAPAIPAGCSAGANLDYAVRAAVLWTATSDGAYSFDVAQTCPLCWSPMP
jgi:hypothetical protein